MENWFQIVREGRKKGWKWKGDEYSRRVGGASFRCVRCARVMMETTRDVVRVLNGANSGVGIGSHAVMSGALIAATSYPVTGLLPEDLHLIRRGHQTDSLQDRGLVRSQKLRATLSWGKKRKGKK